MRLPTLRVAWAVTAILCATCSPKAPVETPVVPDPDEPEPRTEEVRMWFSALQLPASVGANEVLVARVSGSNGPDGCYEFDRLESTRENGTVELVGITVHHLDMYCPLIIPTFEGVEHRISPPFSPGVLRVVARQPDGSYIEGTVSVQSAP